MKLKKTDIFEEDSIIKHKIYSKQLLKYITDAKLKNIITISFIWSCISPVVLMDITIALYQAICFPLYRIPKVKDKTILFSIGNILII